MSCTNSNRQNTSIHQINPPSATSQLDYSNALRDRIAQIAQTAQGRVGVSATALETGESVSLNGNQRFPMQSVYKFPIAMAVLAQVDQGKLKLDKKIRIEPGYVVPGSQILDERLVPQMPQS